MGGCALEEIYVRVCVRVRFPSEVTRKGSATSFALKSSCCAFGSVPQEFPREKCCNVKCFCQGALSRIAICIDLRDLPQGKVTLCYEF